MSLLCVLFLILKMARFSLYNILFFVFVSLVLSDPNVPLRGSKDSKRDEINFPNSRVGIPKVEENAVNGSSVGVVVPENSNVSNGDSELRFLEGKKCEGKSFTMWFQNGLAVTTIKCEGESDGITAIVHAKSGGSGGQETKYLQGEVTSVTVEEDGTTVKVNEKALSGISTSIDAPTDASGGRLLFAGKTKSGEIGADVAKIYTITIGGKNFDVYLPKKSTPSERTTYSLAYNDKIFDTDNKKTQYRLEDNGDLIKGDGSDVILKTEEEDGTTDGSGSGSTSSAIGVFYAVPSLLAALSSILLF